MVKKLILSSILILCLANTLVSGDQYKSLVSICQKLSEYYVIGFNDRATNKQFGFSIQQDINSDVYDYTGLFAKKFKIAAYTAGYSDGQYAGSVNLTKLKEMYKNRCIKILANTVLMK